MEYSSVPFNKKIVGFAPPILISLVPASISIGFLGEDMIPNSAFFTFL
jgi:hypothetical protein